MHDAYDIKSLLKLTFQIESITAYDDCLLLGTRQGHLLMYSVAPSVLEQKYEAQMLRLHKNLSKKPIQQIDTIPENNLLICLSDNIVVVHDLVAINIPVLDTLALTKGATLFALDNMPAKSLTSGDASVIRLCVAVKRKLQLYFWKNGEFKILTKDITLNDIPKVISWGQTALCVGFKGDYSLYDLSGQATELFPTSSSRSLEPTIAKHSNTCFILGRDQTSVFVDESNPKDVGKAVKWKEIPIAVCWDDPYILGLLTDQVVVQTFEPSMFIQSSGDLNKARLMTKGHQGLIYLASVSQVWCLNAVDVTKQRQMLIKDKHFQLAIKLTNISDETEDEKKHKINSIHMLHAFNLFNNRKFSESMIEFLKLETDPVEVIRLFPGLTPNHGGTAGASDETNTEISLQGKELENGLLALIDYLTEVRHKIQKQDLDTKKEKQDLDTKKEKQDLDAKKEKQDLDAKKEKLSERDIAIKQKNIANLLELIDTTLLKCYLQTNDAFVASLLRLNHCRLDEAEAVLLQHCKHSELIILYQRKGQHTKALQLLKDQAKQPDSSLKGHHKTMNYLQHLGSEHINLIFEFSTWILKELPEEGLKIFTEDIAEVENLPRPKVLDFLLREHENLVIPYLEHVIHVWEENNPLFHNVLIGMYRMKLVDKKTNQSGNENLVQHSNIQAKLLTFLEKSNHYTPETVLVHFPVDCMFQERAIVLGKLGQYEQALAIYVYILGNVEQAIKYCNTISEQYTDKDVHVTLIRMLVNPSKDCNLTGPLANVPRDPRTSQPDLETALKLLEQHADIIPPLKVLSVLPDSVPISRIRHFLDTALENELSSRRKTQVLKGLLYAEHLQIQELRMHHESQSVTITDYNVCLVCKKRFGNQSAFVRYPNGDIVHYSCQDMKTINFN